MSRRLSAIDTVRRTAADDIFERLRAEIVSMRLTPGTKLSEADIARRFEVSRQPVREAFIRLSNSNLVAIRPQRATVVRRISKTEVLETRFIRTALEVELVRLACDRGIRGREAGFEASLAMQRSAVEARDTDRFNALDYDFHRLICEAAGRAFAFRRIAENKVYVDRLCMLSLADKAGLDEILEDHETIYARLRGGDSAGAIAAMRLHLTRLDATVAEAQAAYPDYFED
ncbi:GntR family transcriptional regulator [Paralimibaculum aggregatum]|uniref:GntR family transcriptional regulator n=1 Tax=Paralimibaculum aggregatum TaxID=3036245 RepID=A0ABQ6LHA2_9RHOB|nr:GntR family transcriptional regulator [Limibaculum sp. NKW23]GMG82667.1 GntR family transcriptional regulator [Limibaculum sp. NKW23]